MKNGAAGATLPDGCGGLPPQGVGDADLVERHQHVRQGRGLEVGQLQCFRTGL